MTNKVNDAVRLYAESFQLKASVEGSQVQLLKDMVKALPAKLTEEKMEDILKELETFWKSDQCPNVKDSTVPTYKSQTKRVLKHYRDGHGDEIQKAEGGNLSQYLKNLFPTGQEAPRKEASPNVQKSEDLKKEDKKATDQVDYKPLIEALAKQDVKAKAETLALILGGDTEAVALALLDTIAKPKAA